MKKVIEDQIFQTELLNTGDYIRIKQVDKVTNKDHKVILGKEELLVIAEMLREKHIHF